MRSPFPGMDPYVDGYLQPDVHHALAIEIRRQIMPQIRTHYVARLAVTVFHETVLANEVEALVVEMEIQALPQNKMHRSVGTPR